MSDTSEQIGVETAREKHGVNIYLREKLARMYAENKDVPKSHLLELHRAIAGTHAEEFHQLSLHDRVVYAEVVVARRLLDEDCKEARLSLVERQDLLKTQSDKMGTRLLLSSCRLRDADLESLQIMWDNKRWTADHVADLRRLAIEPPKPPTEARQRDLIRQRIALDPEELPPHSEFVRTLILGREHFKATVLEIRVAEQADPILCAFLSATQGTYGLSLLRVSKVEPTYVNASMTDGEAMTARQNFHWTNFHIHEGTYLFLPSLRRLTITSVQVYPMICSIVAGECGQSWAELAYGVRN